MPPWKELTLVIYIYICEVFCFLIHLVRNLQEILEKTIF